MSDKPLQLKPPSRIEDTGCSRSMLVDLALKTIYFAGYASGIDISTTLCLPFTDVTDAILDFLREEKFVETRGGEQFGSATMDYSLTKLGREKAVEALERSAYVGAAPIDLATYWKVVKTQSITNVRINRDDMKKAFEGLILPKHVLALLGPAANSGKSMFLFGKPGNGKTTVSERLGACLGGEVFIPHAVHVDGFVIKIYDPIIHEPLAMAETDDAVAKVQMASHDARWVKCKRPFVMVGGELTLETLDLVYHESAKFYEAPFQMKANGGILLIDDFGRQSCRPQDLLNRWIVPLEKRVDFLNLHTGKKIEVPFDQLIIFSTNLSPKDLVDEAFLRRIAFKIGFESPTADEFRKILMRMCELMDIAYTDEAFKYIWKTQFEERGFEPRAVHPRDILAQIKSIAKFYEVAPALNKELIDRACESYFVKL